MVGYGWEFIVADAREFGAARFSTADGKAPPGFGTKEDFDRPWEGRIYTPLEVSIEQTISGSYEPGAERVMIEGGTVGCHTTRVDVAPKVEVGSRYVFVLADIIDAAGEKTDGPKEAKFAWPVDADGMVWTVDGHMSITRLAEIISAAPTARPPTASPVP
jgi:hypothetical protein